MKAEIKQQWLEALRSGQYQQGQKVLRNEKNEMCCLGVLLDITDRAGWGELQASGRYEHRLATAPMDTLHFSASKKFGLSCRVGDGPYSTEWTETVHVLARMNDGGDSLPSLGFAEIADWIEANIPAE